MRKLNDFEKDIIRTLAEYDISKRANIIDIVSNYLNTTINFKLEYKPLDIDYYLVIGNYFNNNSISKNEIEEILSFQFKTIVDTHSLFILLLNNTLIKFTYDKSQIPPPDEYCFISKNNPPTELLNRVEIEIDKIGDSKFIEFVTSRLFFPSQSLEIYIKDEFQTEDQKNNELIRKQTEQSIELSGKSFKLSKYTSWASVIVALLSVLISVLTYCQNQT